MRRVCMRACMCVGYVYKNVCKNVCIYRDWWMCSCIMFVWLYACIKYVCVLLACLFICIREWIHFGYLFTCSALCEHSFSYEGLRGRLHSLVNRCTPKSRDWLRIRTVWTNILVKNRFRCCTCVFGLIFVCIGIGVYHGEYILRRCLDYSAVTSMLRCNRIL